MNDRPLPPAVALVGFIAVSALWITLGALVLAAVVSFIGLAEFGTVFMLGFGVGVVGAILLFVQAAQARRA